MESNRAEAAPGRRAMLGWLLKLRFIALASSLVLTTYVANASPLEDPTLAGASTFTGPTAAHSTAIFINPASMGMVSRGIHVLALGTMRLSQLSVDREIIEADGSSSSGPEVRGNTLSPGGMVAFDIGLADKYRLGVSLHTAQARRFASGHEPLRYHTLGGHLYQYTATGSASFAAHSRILFGFGISLGYSSVRLDFARDTALEAGVAGVEADCEGQPCGIENPLADQRYRIEASTRTVGGLFAAKNLGLIGGTMIRITKKWWIAASIVFPPGSISGPLDLPGEVRVEQAPRDGDREVRGDSEVIVRPPVSLYAGVRGPLLEGRLDLLAHVRWQNLSVSQNFDVRMFGGDLQLDDVPRWYPRYLGYADELTAVAGVETPEGNRMRFGGRLVVQSGAVDAGKMSPLAPAPWNVGANGGAEIRVGDHFVLAGVYGLTVFAPTDASPSDFDPLARLSCVESDYALDECVAARQGRAIPTAAGAYSRFEHSLTLSLRYDTL